MSMAYKQICKWDRVFNPMRASYANGEIWKIEEYEVYVRYFIKGAHFEFEVYPASEFEGKWEPTYVGYLKGVWVL
jgi:hypothetical protein